MRHQNIVFHGLLKHIPWPIHDRLVDQHNGDWDDRVVRTKAHLIAMLYAQFCGARSLREIETNLQSNAGKLYHLGGWSGRIGGYGYGLGHSGMGLGGVVLVVLLILLLLGKL